MSRRSWSAAIFFVGLDVISLSSRYVMLFDIDLQRFLRFYMHTSDSRSTEIRRCYLHTKRGRRWYFAGSNLELLLSREIILWFESLRRWRHNGRFLWLIIRWRNSIIIIIRLDFNIECPRNGGNILLWKFSILQGEITDILSRFLFVRRNNAAGG